MQLRRIDVMNLRHVSTSVTCQLTLNFSLMPWFPEAFRTRRQVELPSSITAVEISSYPRHLFITGEPFRSILFGLVASWPRPLTQGYLMSTSNFLGYEV